MTSRELKDLLVLCGLLPGPVIERLSWDSQLLPQLLLLPKLS
jgi:hypothetical protein